MPNADIQYQERTANAAVHRSLPPNRVVKLSLVGYLSSLSWVEMRHKLVRTPGHLCHNPTSSHGQVPGDNRSQRNSGVINPIPWVHHSSGPFLTLIICLVRELDPVDEGLLLVGDGWGDGFGGTVDGDGR